MLIQGNIACSSEPYSQCSDRANSRFMLKEGVLMEGFLNTNNTFNYSIPCFTSFSDAHNQRHGDKVVLDKVL